MTESVKRCPNETQHTNSFHVVQFGSDGYASAPDVESVEEPGHRFVRLDHEHLDQRVGERAILRAHVVHVSFIIEEQFRLGQIQDDHPITQTSLSKRLGESVRLMDGLDHLRLAVGVGAHVPARLLEVPIDDRLRLEIGQSLARANDGGGEPLADHDSSMIKRYERTLAETVDPFLQRADPVGEYLRKHRQNDSRKVCAVSTSHCLEIHRIPLLDERGHVRDVHSKCPLPRVLVEVDRDRIIEIASIWRIDREDHLLGEILPIAWYRLPVILEGLGGSSGDIHL